MFNSKNEISNSKNEIHNSKINYYEIFIIMKYTILMNS